MKLKIVNKAELDAWLKSHQGSCLTSLKGPAPKGATYSDGDPIVRPVNVAWVEGCSGDRFNIRYQTQEEADRE